MRDFQLPGRSTMHSLKGMAAASSPQAALAAIDVLRAGGTAADAAVTAAAVLCVSEPQMTGIGGDGFALVGLPDGRVEGLNGSGRSALGADADWLARSGLAGIDPHSIHAVTVPGVVDCWAALLARHGSMTLAEALAPAIRLAEEGVPTMPRVAADWAIEVDRLARDGGAAQHYLKRGRAPQAGEVMAYPALARTLRTIAREGRDGFYGGEIAAKLAAFLEARGSLLRAADFAAHRSDWVEPIKTRFAGRDIFEIPPNGQGLTALIALNILSELDLAAEAPESVLRRHYEIEAVKLAWVYRDRFIADPGSNPAPVEALLSRDLARKLAGFIRPDGVIAVPEDAAPMPGSDTVYLTVVDSKRMAVSFINSIYHSFGSGLAEPETGILLQNRGANFVTVPGHPNCIGPAKRPLHTIIPALVQENGRTVMSYGVMGGAYQPMGHAAVAVNRFIYGMDAQEALDFPRAFGEVGKVSVETGVPESVAAGLAALGHQVSRAEEALGGGQIIEIDPGTGQLTGASDPRKDGLALGY